MPPLQLTPLLCVPNVQALAPEAPESGAAGVRSPSTTGQAEVVPAPALQLAAPPPAAAAPAAKVPAVSTAAPGSAAGVAGRPGGGASSAQCANMSTTQTCDRIRANLAGNPLVSEMLECILRKDPALAHDPDQLCQELVSDPAFQQVLGASQLDPHFCSAAIVMGVLGRAQAAGQGGGMRSEARAESAVPQAELEGNEAAQPRRRRNLATYVCEYCAKEGPKLKKCGRCGARFCSTQCFEQAWKSGHKRVCAPKGNSPNAGDHN